jgi:hypothetical protein
VVCSEVVELGEGQMNIPAAMVEKPMSFSLYLQQKEISFSIKCEVFAKRALFSCFN